MANNDATKVSFGKPKAAGALFVAPIGTTLPTNATSTLDAAFVNVGYVSEDGLVNSVSTDTESVTAWGGDTVLTGQTSFGETFTANLIETSLAALETYYGKDNVTESGGVITVQQNSAPLDPVVLVAEIVLTGGRVKRIVVAHAQIADRSGDISYTDGDAIAYPVVFQALPDSNGNTHIEYIAVIAS